MKGRWKEAIGSGEGGQEARWMPKGLTRFDARKSPREWQVGRRLSLSASRSSRIWLTMLGILRGFVQQFTDPRDVASNINSVFHLKPRRGQQATSKVLELDRRRHAITT